MKLNFVSITNLGLVLLGGGLAVNYFTQSIPLWIIYVIGGGLITAGTLLHTFSKR